MKKPLLFLSLLTVIVFFNACQKELSVETGSTPSKGSLQADGTGDCLPKNVNGIYEVAKVLNATTNYIEVQVNVTTVGSYLVYTDTVNGVFFRAIGVFTATGMNTVRLKGNGTPVAAGINNYVVTYDVTICAVAVTTLPVGGATPAVLTLTGDPGACMGAVVSGNYIVGTPMTVSNSVVISVNVTTAGTYSITTVTTNGIVFSGSGSVAAGAQTITLTASGQPVTDGPTNVPVKVGTSTCSFTLTVTATAPPPGDYYPRTTNSNWSYEFDGDPDDSVLIKVIANTLTVGGNPFNIFMGTLDASQGFDSSGYFRKAGGNYYRFENLEDYLALDATQRAEFIFLKDDQPVNTVWTTATYSGAILGTPLDIRIKFTISQKDAAIVVKGITYPNTIVVLEQYEVKAPGAPASTFVDATAVLGFYKDYYAKNVGWIKDEYFDTPGATIPAQILELRRKTVFP